LARTKKPRPKSCASAYVIDVELTRLEASPLSVPLREPFVIATGTLVETRSVLVRVIVASGTSGASDSGGRREAAGLGEAAALPPVTDCDQPDLLRGAAVAAAALRGLTFGTVDELAAGLSRAVPSPVLRAGIEAAVLDAWGKLVSTPVCTLLASAAGAGVAEAVGVESDITIPIGEPAHMAALAREHHAAGFSTFKVKVGRDREKDIAALAAIRTAVPEARFRIDANGGYSLTNAQAFVRAVDGLPIELFEQPCPRGADEDAATLAKDCRIPLVADESLRSDADLDRLLRIGWARGVNLKLVKLGGLVAAYRIGRRARAAGLSLMCGAMVETRLGLTAMLHVVAALGGVDFVDLDTQLLLAEEHFRGGYDQTGPKMTLRAGPGLQIQLRNDG
jgi:L-alanine-DL-glutamate epimerase-like enolase superfamily enzyme